MIQLANGGGLRPARTVVVCDFSYLVRLRIRSAQDPIVLDSIKVIDQVLKRDSPEGLAGSGRITTAMDRKTTGKPSTGVA